MLLVPRRSKNHVLIKWVTFCFFYNFQDNVENKKFLNTHLPGEIESIYWEARDSQSQDSHSPPTKCKFHLLDYMPRTKGHLKAVTTLSKHWYLSWSNIPMINKITVAEVWTTTLICFNHRNIIPTALYYVNNGSGVPTLHENSFNKSAQQRQENITQIAM